MTPLVLTNLPLDACVCVGVRAWRHNNAESEQTNQSPVKYLAILHHVYSLDGNLLLLIQSLVRQSIALLRSNTSPRSLTQRHSHR